VNTVNITGEALAEALSSAWQTVEIKDVEPLHGGQWASMAHVRLAHVPPHVPEEVVVRVVPDALMGAKELAVQSAVADAGVATPHIHLTGQSGGSLGGAWAVMDYVDGRQLLAGFDGVAAIRQLPLLLRRLPRQLAATMTAIHGIDPEPIVERVRAAAPRAALSIDEIWHHLHAASGPFDSLRSALEHLRETMPSQGRAVVCHGDFHPFNLLIDDAGKVTVLDWTGAAIAPAAFDVAFTGLLLRNPPLDAPSFLRPAISAGARVLAGRFLRTYHSLNRQADLDDLGWYVALHASRVLLDLGTWRAEDDERAESHPWRLVAPGAARTLHRVTGVNVAV
jgi:aminoglycoside phosphotransferase (APT) family kinase protein